MSKELDYIADLERENRLLGERCNQLLKDKGELTDQISDIKANCDLAIEGRDIKIKELELELTVEKDLHQEETNLHLHAEEYIKSLEKENKTLEGCLLAEQEHTQMLEKQIEKMKCCGNCKHQCSFLFQDEIDCVNNGLPKWEIKEK